MLGDVRCELGIGAGLTDNNAIFLIAVVGREKPGRAIFLVKYAAFFEHGQGLVNAAGLRQALFRIPVVEGNAKFPEVVLNIRANGLERLLANVIEAVTALQCLGCCYECVHVRFLVAVRRIGWQAIEHIRGAGNH